MINKICRFEIREKMKTIQYYMNNSLIILYDFYNLYVKKINLKLNVGAGTKPLQCSRGASSSHLRSDKKN